MTLFSVGTFVGMLLHIVYKESEMLGNAKRTDPDDCPRATAAKLPPVSKIEQRVGTIRNQLSPCLLMNLRGC